MPAAYAHHTFGEACLATLPPKLKAICLQYRQLYDIGVHGPDILFYHNPLVSSKVNRYGSALHHRSGVSFFQSAKEAYQENRENRKAMMAYLLGVLAHFTLDSACHDLVNASAEETGLSHNLIESQYEVFLMEKDGKDPMKVDRSLTLEPSAGKAEIIARFYPFEEKEILKSMKGQRTVLHLFYSPAQIKKKFLRKLIRAVGVKGDFGDLFLDREHLYVCGQINETLLERQSAAEKLYPQLAQNLVRFLYDKEALGAQFRYDFEGIWHSV